MKNKTNQNSTWTEKLKINKKTKQIQIQIRPENKLVKRIELLIHDYLDFLHQIVNYTNHKPKEICCGYKVSLCKQSCSFLPSCVHTALADSN